MIVPNRWLPVLIGCAFLTGCGDLLGIDPERPHGLWISDTGILMHPGEEVMLSARTQATRRSEIRVSISPRWWTDDSDVIRVTGRRVQALAEGEATVWVEEGDRRDSASVSVVAPGTSPTHRWRSVATYAGGTCALDVQGRAFCWGSDNSGELGTGGGLRQWTHTHRPVAVATQKRFEEIDVGRLFVCARTMDGEVWCWGLHNGSRLGHGRTQVEHETRPVRVEFAGRATAITTGSSHSCLLDEDGRAHCWGSNLSYQLGTDRAILSTRYAGGRTVPVSFDGRFVSISTRGHHTCGITMERELYCWGSVPAGSGFQTEVMRTPTQIPTPDEPTEVYAGDGNTCYINTTGAVRCWGGNEHGQSGSPPDAGRALPYPADWDHRYESLALSGGSTCGIAADGTASCWGGWRTLPPEHDLGGCPTYPCSDVPVPVPGDHRFRQLSIYKAMCGVTERDAIVCWNQNDWGQLGIGRPAAEEVAVPTLYPGSPLTRPDVENPSSKRQIMKLLNGVVLTVGVLLLYPPCASAQEGHSQVPPANTAGLDSRAVQVEPSAGPALQQRVEFVSYEGPDWSLRSGERAAPVALTMQEENEWPGWVQPALFIGGGALVGAAWGTYVMVTADEWMGLPAHVMTVPVGMAAGAVLAFLFS